MGPDLIRLAEGGGIGFMEDNAKSAYIASFIQGLPFAHKNVMGLTQIIEELQEYLMTRTRKCLIP
jgi:hypothetical protein